MRRTIWFDGLHMKLAPVGHAIPFEPSASGTADVLVNFRMRASYRDYALSARRQWSGSKTETCMSHRNINYPVGRLQRVIRFHHVRFWTR